MNAPGWTRSVHGGEGGIRTLGGHEAHNGFRDRPIQPLWHLSGVSYAADIITENISAIGLQLRAGPKFRIHHLPDANILQFILEHHCRFFLSMHQKHLPQFPVRRQRIFHQEILSCVA